LRHINTLVMMYSIENSQLKVTIAALGAELQSIFSKEHQLEYLWNADPAFWPKHSPVLFPIIGTLRDNRYTFNGQWYELGRHGFAREKNFAPASEAPESIQFLLKDDEHTRQHFPFEFEFRIMYKINQNELGVTYEVKNPGKEDLYFSVGGHPAFKLPLVGETSYDDYYLEFNEEETKPRWPISKDGLIEKEPVPLLVSTDRLPLSKQLFAKDAVVLKFPTSSIVSLRSDKTVHGLDFNFEGFPYLGLWAAPRADFLCIEPWCGIADPVDSDQQLIHKEGIERLSPGAVFSRVWTATFF